MKNKKLRFNFKDNRKIINTTFFPAKLKKSTKKNVTLVGIGCNVGNCIRRFKEVFRYINSNPNIDIIQTSIIYKNPPFGYLAQNDFYNSILILKTNYSAYRLLKYLLRVEKRFGRKRSFKNAPRTLDLDIIIFNNEKINKKDLIIPHPFFKERDSVLIPLLYKDFFN